MKLRRLLLAALVIAGAAGNLLRAATWTQASGFIAPPFGSTTPSPEAVRVNGYAKVERPAPAWRPLRIDFRARTSGATPVALDVAIDGEELPRVTVGAGATGAQPTGAAATGAAASGSGWQAIALRGSNAAASAGLVTLRLSTAPAAAGAPVADLRPATAPDAGGTNPPGAGGAGATPGAGATAIRPAAAATGLEIIDLRVTPIPAVAPLLRYGGGGALFGFIVWLLLVWRGPVPSSRAAATAADAHGGDGTFVTDFESRPPARAREIALAGLLIFLLLAAWALGRPPLQTPDEPHHFLRATSLLENGPWVGGASTLRIDPRFFNPQSWGAPRLNALIVDQRPVTREDVAALKATPWLAPEAPLPFPPTAYVAILSYPPLYYWSVFAIGQPIVSLARLTPYEASYVFRLASVLAVTLAWTGVYLLLRRTRDTAPFAEPMLALLILNPMLVFMSSGINSDALSIPLITLGVLACWRTLTTGRGAALTCLVTLAALFTKPSAAQMAGALILAIAWGVWRGWALPTRAWTTVRAVGLAAALAYAAFYAWSPTQFTFEPGHATIGLTEYTRHVVRALPDVWLSFWGKLGWLDYQLAWPWYACLFALTLVCATLHLRARRGAPAFTQFALLYGLAFFGSTIVGGFVNLAVAGYMLQGRYFLPAAVALAPCVIHEARWQRWLLPAGVLVLHLLLFQATVVRYFGGDWSLLWDALPFV